MWARNYEIVFGLWLALSPFVFGHVDDTAALANDLACGGLVVLIALLSWWRPLRRAHLAELVVAAWLVGGGWLQTRADATPTAQNQLALGLLVGMFAIIPPRASRPPVGWRTREPAR